MALNRSDNTGSIQHDNLRTAVFSSAYSLMVLQVVSRLFTFMLNQCLLRLTSPQVFGIAAIQFELIFSTVLFLSREGVRNSVLRVPPDRRQREHHSKIPWGTALSNLTTLPLIFGIPSAVLATYLYGCFAGYETRNQPLFFHAIIIYAVATIVELMSEQFHNQAMCEIQTQIRVRAEGTGIVIKPVIVIVLLLYDSKIRNDDGHLALVAFAVGQLAYAIAVLGVYVSHYKGISLWPKRLRPSSRSQISDYFDPHILRLSITMTFQSIFKQVLTEGDKLILTKLSPLQDQGGYALAVNYGSLLARVLFQPMEETLRLYYPRILANTKSEQQQRSGGGIHQAATSLVSLLAIQCAFSVILLTFGPVYLPILLCTILPPRYHSTSAPKVFEAWIWYIPILAVNGGLEAFLVSVASAQDLKVQSRWMALFSSVYLFAALMFYRWGLGDPSLVYANMMNLTVRIAYCWFYVNSYFRSRGASSLLIWRNALPGPEFCIVIVLSKLVVRYSDWALGIGETIKNHAGLQTNIIMHLILGGLLGLLCVTTWWLSSGRFVIYKIYGKLA